MLIQCFLFSDMLFHDKRVIEDLQESLGNLDLMESW